MASDLWLRTILIVRKETRCRHIVYSFRLTARVILYAPSHIQDNTYHDFCYTSCGELAGTRNSSKGPHYEWAVRRTLKELEKKRKISVLWSKSIGYTPNTWIIGAPFPFWLDYGLQLWAKFYLWNNSRTEVCEFNRKELLFNDTPSTFYLRLYLRRIVKNHSEGRKKEIFYLTTHSTHFIYGYVASDIW